MNNRALFETIHRNVLPEHRASFKNYLIGALIAVAPEDIFAKATRIAVDCMYEYGPFNKAEQGASDRTVWITNESGHNFAPAERWGTIRFLSKGRLNRFAVGDIHRQFEEQLCNSTSEDFLLVTSLTIMNVVAAAILSAMHKRLNLLLYHDGAYIVRELLLNREKVTLEEKTDATV